MNQKSNEMGISYEVYVISEDKQFKELFESIPEVTLVVQFPSIERDIPCKAIFVDGKTLPVRELKHIRDQYPSIPIFFQAAHIQTNHSMENVITTCIAHDIQHLREDFTQNQIIEVIDEKLFGRGMKNKKRIVSFMGTHSGAGVSTTVLNVADLLAKRIDGKVIVLSLNMWDPSDYFLEYSGRYLNEVRIDLSNKNFTDEKFLNAVHHYKDSFYHLAGNRDIKQQRYYNNEEIDYLISRAREYFDVVLIDAGPHFDNACYAQSYINSDLRFLVTTQEPKGYEGYFPHIFEQLLAPLGSTGDDFFLIINRLNFSNTLATEKDIVDVLKMPHLTSVPDEGLLGSSAITQRILLSQNGPSKEYAEMLLPIVRAIIGKYGLKQTLMDEPIVQKGFLGKFKKKKTVSI